MGEFSLTHLLLLGVIFLIFFGPKRLPQLGQSLGKAIRGFKEGLNEMDADSKDVTQRPTELPHTQQQNMKDRKSTRLNSSHTDISRMPSSA